MAQETEPSSLQITESSARVPAPSVATSATNPPDPDDTFQVPEPNIDRPRNRHTPADKIASPDTDPVTVPKALTRVNVPEKVSAPVWVAVSTPRERVTTRVHDDRGELAPRLRAETTPELEKVHVVDPPPD